MTQNVKATVTVDKKTARNKPFSHQCIQTFLPYNSTNYSNNQKD